MKDILVLDNEKLLEIYNSENEAVIGLKDGKLIHTDDEETIEEYQNNPDISFIFWASNFEDMFILKEELTKRGLTKQ